MVNVRMFGTFLLWNDKGETGGNNYKHSRAWDLLAYLVFNHKRIIPYEELLRLFENADRIENPRGTLRTVLTRIRTVLRPLGEDISRYAILSENGGYGWNPEIDISLDAEEFERLVKNSNSRRKALDIFKGFFLDRLSGMRWVDETAEYFKRLFKEAVLMEASNLEENERFNEALVLIINAQKIYPYDEELSLFNMRLRMELKDYDGAEMTYIKIKKYLLEYSERQPNEAMQKLYKELRHLKTREHLSGQEIVCRLLKHNLPPGIIICDLSYFIFLYKLLTRGEGRKTGQAAYPDTTPGIPTSGTQTPRIPDTSFIHILLISIKARKNCFIKPSYLKKAMELLKELLKQTLRSEDAASVLSSAQCLIMLRGINTENSRRVLGKLENDYINAYPSMQVEVTGDLLI